MLNLPQFEERPPARVHADSAAHQVPGGGAAGGTPAGGAQDVASPNDPAMVANLQYNSPMSMYSGDNVVEALEGQTGGRISSVVG